MSPSMMRLLVLLFLPLAQAAPKEGAMRRPDPEVQPQPLPNPFQPGQERLRLLQSYLKGLEQMDQEPEHMSREQVLLYLVALHDYDQSGQLDGLELLSMLTAALAPGAADAPTPDPVVLVVDQVLETQDLNGDGLMTPAELINFPGEAPKHAEPLVPHAGDKQPPFTESPPRPGVQDAQVPGEQARGHAEAEGGPPSPGGGARGHAEVEGPPSPGGAMGGHAEAEEVLNLGEGPGGHTEAEGHQSLEEGPGAEEEASDTRAGAEELPGGARAATGSPAEMEVHAIQLENDEM